MRLREEEEEMIVTVQTLSATQVCTAIHWSRAVPCTFQWYMYITK